MESTNSKLKIELKEEGISIEGEATTKELVNVTCYLMDVVSRTLSKHMGVSRESIILAINNSVIQSHDESVLEVLKEIRVNE